MMPFGMWTRRKEPCVRWGVHWRHMANTTELSVCNGDAALCQITMTTLLSMACGIAILFGPYFCNTELQYLFHNRFAHNSTFLPWLARLIAEHFEMMPFLCLVKCRYEFWHRLWTVRYQNCSFALKVDLKWLKNLVLYLQKQKQNQAITAKVLQNVLQYFSLSIGVCIAVIFIRSHRTTTQMWPIVTHWVVWSVGLSVCYTSQPCKNGWIDWDAIWVEDSGGPREPCVTWGSRSPMGRGNFEGRKVRSIVKYRGTLRSSVQKRLNRLIRCLGCGVVDSGGPKEAQVQAYLPCGANVHKFNRYRFCQVAPMCSYGRAHWRHLANMIEPSVCGGDAALCQITFTTC